MVLMFMSKVYTEKFISAVNISQILDHFLRMLILIPVEDSFPLILFFVRIKSLQSENIFPT